MKEFEREYLRRALRAGAGSKGRTATLLGISRKNLWEKLKRHGLVDPEEEATSSGLSPLAPDAAPPAAPVRSRDPGTES